MEIEPKPKRKKTGGRKKGTPNKASYERESRLKESGQLPNEILLNVARYHFDRAFTERQKIKPNQTLIREEHAMATHAASQAAPYVHPRLAAIATTNHLGAVTLEQLVGASFGPPANANALALTSDVIDDLDAAVGESIAAE